MITFTDRDGKKFQVWLRGRWSSLRSAKKLIEILDNSTSVEGLKTLHPTWPAGLHETMAKSFFSHTHMENMRILGMISRSKFIS